jgi:hypothetical protein
MSAEVIDTQDAVADDAPMSQEEENAIYDEVISGYAVDDSADDDDGDDVIEDGLDDDDGDAGDDDDSADADADDGNDDEDEDDEDDEIAAAMKAGKKLLEAKKGDDDSGKDDDDDDLDEADDKDNQAEPPKPFEFSDDDSELIQSLTNSLPEGDVTLPDGSKVNLREFATEYPEAAAMTAVMTRSLNHETKALKAELAKQSEALQAKTQALEAELGDFRFFTALADAGHADARQVSKSEEFNKWLDNADKAIQALADSGEVEHAAHVLKAYKASIAREAAKSHDQKTGAKHSKKKSLHKGSIKSRSNAQRTQKTEDEIYDEVVFGN